MIADQNSHRRIPVDYALVFLLAAINSVGAKRLFATRPSRSSIILAIEDNPCLLPDDLFGDQFADRPYDAELADVDQQRDRLLAGEGRR